MRKHNLVISGINLKDNSPFEFVIRCSNEFVLAYKYYNLDSDLYITSWTIYNRHGEAGNSHPYNAGAYLCEHMEELTGLNLA